jgi:ABC-type cobalamin/Fe3+-siderophores transport system ATPase subunit
MAPKISSCIKATKAGCSQDRIVAVDDMEKRRRRFDARPYALVNPQFKNYPIFGEFRGHDNPERILTLDPLPQALSAMVAGAGLSVAGAVLVENRDVLKMDAMAIARRIGYVAQHQTAGRLTAFDAILMGRRPHIHCRVSDKDLRVVDGAIKSLHLEILAMRYIDQMSGGELLEILKLIRRVVREHPVCAIMTMHDLSTALRFADKCLFLKDGRIHAAIPAQQVSAEIIREVYDIDVEIHYHHACPVVIPA